MTGVREITVGKNEAGKRFDKLLERILKNANKSFIYKMLRKKNITLNGRKAAGNEVLSEGDLIKIFFSDETFEKFAGNIAVKCEDDNNFKSMIIYEDEDILIADKPVGVLSQKAGSDDYSMNEYLCDYMIKKGELTQEEMMTFRPAFVNRLDRNTSGIMIAGKSLAGLKQMSAAIKDRSAEKYYLAVVSGQPKDRAHMEAYLRKNDDGNRVIIYDKPRDGAVKIITEYELLRRSGALSLLQVKLVTGRTHQIRAHLAHCGIFVVGDYKYGSPRVNDEYRQRCAVTSQMLHSYRFIMPDGRVFSAKIPELFNRVLDDAKKR